ncbi:hypothetical protein E4U42_006629 [Claviceps africana]|uniref:Uncharacterized protein n=1 Tax=Claviceps africana TaxID=83212 RepID=A0A8K0J2Z9_9HYPO|nr:hypothetical protein E4U42_006629 [Claviceps africana]
MLSKILPDSPPPRPAHIRSVEENIAYFRRCSPESTYNLVQIQNPGADSERPSSRTSSVHSSDEESADIGPREPGDAVDYSESTKFIEASLLERDNSASSWDSDTPEIDPEQSDDDAGISRMSPGSIEPLDATKEVPTGMRLAELLEPHAGRSLVNVGHADAAQGDPISTRDAERQHGDFHLREMEPARTEDANVLAQAFSIDSSWFTKACEWCCRPALPAADVCSVHRMAEREETQRQWNMEKISDLVRFPLPSRRTIVRAYHGKIKVYSSGDPAHRNGFYSKKCACPHYRPFSIDLNYV